MLLMAAQDENTKQLIVSIYPVNLILFLLQRNTKLKGDYMKKAFKLTIARRSTNGATIEYFLSSVATQARIESLEAKGFVVVMTQVEYFNNSYVDVI